MSKTVKVSCPMDCPDLCRFLVTVDNNRVAGLRGDPDHPLTRGVICWKARDLVRRMEHPDRLKVPLVRTKGGWEAISWEQVLDTMADRLTRIKDSLGFLAVLDYVGDGYGGLKAGIQTLFFNAFGGATRPEGSLCWGAGLAAQKYDFGAAKGHFPDDVLHSKLILVWGRNPRETGIHLFSRLKRARKKGARVVVIDPVRTATARAFDDYIRIRPGTDGALALAMARVIIEHGMANDDFIHDHVVGFEAFRAQADLFTPTTAQAVTGIPAPVIQSLAMDYARCDQAAIYIGYGLQRYKNGGNTVRAIDALAAITGKIGRPGCGANYAAFSLRPFLSGKSLSRYFPEPSARRGFTIGQLGTFLETVQAPPIEAAFVSSANPLNQSPDLGRTIQAFSKIPFKVVFDHFMTDTARFADMVLPAASVFEQDDIFITSMYSPYLNVSQKALDPPAGLMTEGEVWIALARRMGLDGALGFSDPEDYLKKCIAPLLDRFGLSLSDLSSSDFCDESHRIAWQDFAFDTPSGKIELFSESALKDGLSPTACFAAPEKGTDGFPLRLITAHTEKSLHSQGFALVDDIPVVYVNEKTGRDSGLAEGSRAWVRSDRAAVRARVCITDAVDEGTAFMYQGWWHKSGAVNFLIGDRISDMGRQAAYYETFCRVDPAD